MTSRRAVLGVELSTGAVRAVVLRDGCVTWTHEAPIDAAHPLEEALDAVIAGAPMSRWERLPVTVAVGPALAQLRQLHGLPEVRDDRTLAAIVQQSAGRYFRQNGIPMVTTPVAAGDANARWAGAIEEPVVRAVMQACARPRVRRVTLVPTAAVLGHAVPDGRFTWCDGEVALELLYGAGALRECRCLPSRLAAASSVTDAMLDAPLRALGDDAVSYAGAYAAARGGAASLLALRPARGADGPERQMIQTAMPLAACVVSVMLALAAPVLSAARQQRVALDRLAAISSTSTSARALETALADSIGLLSELSAFQLGAPSTTLLLASLTRAIHPPAMLVNLRLESDGGTLTALAPSAASLLAMLDAVTDISGAAISGSVTPESPVGQPMPMPMQMPLGAAPAAPPAPERKLTRVTVRFHWSGERRAATNASRLAR